MRAPQHAVAQCSSSAGDSAGAGESAGAGDSWRACGGGRQLPGAPRAGGAEEQRGETELAVGAEEQSVAQECERREADVGGRVHAP